MGEVIDMEKIGVWQRIDNLVFMLEKTEQAPPFHIRNRFTLLVQDQPHGSRAAECEQIADEIVTFLNSSRESGVDNG